VAPKDNYMKKNLAQRHPDWFAMSVYEDPENLIPVFNRIGVVSIMITITLNVAAGYLLSEYRSVLWVQDLVAFVLGLSDAFATRFNDLQSLTQDGGYYYVGAMVVSLVAALVMSVVFYVTYALVTICNGRARPFHRNNFVGIIMVSIFCVAGVYLFFFQKMDTGPYLGMNRMFFPGIFPALAACAAYLVAATLGQPVIFVVKFILHLKGEKSE